MVINLDTLPQSVLAKIPLSLRTFQKEYELTDLPFPIQKLIEDYLEYTIDLNYPTVYDTKPELSEFGDFGILTTVEDAVVNYLINYFKTLPGDYPFDPSFGCRLKLYLQTKDTMLRQTLISTEATRIAEVISADFGAKVEILELYTESVQSDIMSAAYKINIKVKINDKVKKIDFIETSI